MSIATELTEAGRDYAAAYAAHYTDHDLPTALKLHLKVISSHPDTKEAGYARAQAQNIINATVPDQELLEAEVALAVGHFVKDEPTQRDEESCRVKAFSSTQAVMTRGVPAPAEEMVKGHLVVMKTTHQSERNQ